LAKVKLYEHQEKAVDFALGVLGYRDKAATSKGVAILAEMGTGKTLITLTLAGELYQRGEIKRMLVVCPKSITNVWKEEFAKFADFPNRVEILDGTNKRKALRKLKFFASALQVAVVNYESAWRMDELKDFKPCLIVCDESSKIKNAYAQQSGGMHELGKISKHNIILTGTPITQSPLDFYSQYKFLDDTVFVAPYRNFETKYAVMQNGKRVGYKNLDDLTERAHSIAFRITKAEALDLPDKVDVTRRIDLESWTLENYKELAKRTASEIETDKAACMLTKLLRLSQLTGGFNEQGDQVSKAKLNALQDILDDCLDAGKKLVVFARFIPEMDAIETLLKQHKIGYSLIKGATKDRAEQVRRFQENPGVRVFIGQLQTTGMGLTLTAADTAVFYSLSYNYSDYEQAKARIHRIGQKNKCTYIHLVAKSTIDEKVLSALNSKKNLADLVVDDWKSLLKE
jgi:SNF2 family DNA or RNA helicase